jgi:hypothetical protein
MILRGRSGIADGHGGGKAPSRLCLQCGAGILGALLAVSIAASEPAPAAADPQSTPGQAAPGTQTVTVEARRAQEHLESQAASFVDSLAANPWGEPLARWQPAICMMMIGLPRDRGTAVFRRIAQIATDAGIPLDKPDCSANLVILVTRDPEGSLDKLWSSNPKLFNEDRGVSGIKHFIHGSEPVRVWHNVCSEAHIHAQDLGRGPWCQSGAVATGVTGSLLSFESVRVIYGAIVVVDQERAKGLDDTQLAGYAAMLALVQTRDSRVPTMPSILSLSSDSQSAKPQDLSTWDKAFLKALYSVDPSDTTQVQEIAQKMGQLLAP